jgi:hypothetical protein
MPDVLLTPRVGTTPAVPVSLRFSRGSTSTKSERPGWAWLAFSRSAVMFGNLREASECCCTGKARLRFSLRRE